MSSTENGTSMEATDKAVPKVQWFDMSRCLILTFFCQSDVSYVSFFQCYKMIQIFF